MENLSFYLKKFRRIVSSNEEEKKIIGEVVSQIIHFSILPKDIQIVRGIVTFQVKSTVKNELFIHKEEILRTLREKGVVGINTLR